MPVKPVRSECDIAVLCVTTPSFFIKRKGNFCFLHLPFESSLLCCLLWSSPVLNDFHCFHFYSGACPLEIKSAYLNYMSWLTCWRFVVNISVCRNVRFSPCFFLVSAHRLQIWTVCLYKCPSLLEVARLCLLSERQHMFAVFPAGSQEKKVRSPAL